MFGALKSNRCPCQILPLLAAWGMVGLLGTNLQAQTDHSFPMVLSTSPLAVQAGTSAELSVASYYIQRNAFAVQVSGDGVTAQPVPEKPSAPNEKLPANKRSIFHRKYRFSAAATAIPGLRDFRLGTLEGVSTLGAVLVTRDPVLLEKRENDTPETAQAVAWPVAVCGTLERDEDLDYYQFTVSAGTTLTFWMRMATSQVKVHDGLGISDPLLTLYTTQGRLLATVNNTIANDPVLTYTFRDAGTYRVLVRDVRYKGNPHWSYCLEIHDRPVVTHTFPVTVQPGKTSELIPYGYHLPAGEKLAVAASSASTASSLPVFEPELLLTTGRLKGAVTNEFTVLVHPLAGILEQRPQPDAPQAVSLPSLVQGRIGRPGEVDRYTVTARRGEKLTLEVYARRCRSPLDPVLRIKNAQGELLVENDDQQSLNMSLSDSRIESWQVPADGTYSVELSDLNEAGGTDFVYALELRRSQPHFRLELETDKTHLSPGLSYPVYVHAERREGFTGSIQLSAGLLPAGVTAHTETIPPNAQHGCIVVTAAPQAPVSVLRLQIQGTANLAPAGEPPRMQTALARPLQEIRTAGRPLFVFAPDHSISVGPSQNVKSVKISTSRVALKPGETARVDVEIERVPQYTGLVRLEAYVHYFEVAHASSLPPGVSLDLERSHSILSPGETRGHLIFQADAHAHPAPPRLVPVMAQVAMSLCIRFNYCQPLWLSVEPAGNPPPPQSTATGSAKSK